MSDEGRERIWHPRPTTTSSDEASSSNATAPDNAPSGSTSTYTVNIHNPAVTYGGLNPEIEEHVLVVKSVPDDDLRYGTTDRRKLLGPDLDEDLDVPIQRRSTSVASRGS